MFQDEAGFGRINKPNIVGAEKVFVHPFPVTIFGNTGMYMERQNL